MTRANKSHLFELHSSPIITLSTEIGRGHPNYLDNVCQLLVQKFPNLVCTDVFEQSQVFSLLFWKLVRKAYLLGGKGGLFTKIYNQIRKKQKIRDKSIFLKILGKDLRKNFSGFKGICLVEHPLVAQILKDVCRVFYVHGEMAAPLECAVTGVGKIFVPLEESKENLVRFGVNPINIEVTGLLIEPGLVKNAKEIFEARLERIKKENPLTVGLFTSGAYPKKHLEKILKGVNSVVEQGMRGIIFAGTNFKKYLELKEKLKNGGLKISEDIEDSFEKEKDWEVKLVWRNSRPKGTQREVKLFSQLDCFVAAPHERTNWAVGLGLPMFVLFPLIGTFAPQNLSLALKQKVAYSLDTLEKATNLGKIIIELKENGKLQEMAENGFDFYKIDGVEKTVGLLEKEIPASFA
jgi:hypothetical protein